MGRFPSISIIRFGRLLNNSFYTIKKNSGYAMQPGVFKQPLVKWLMIKRNHRTNIIIQTKRGNSGESGNGYPVERICKRRRKGGGRRAQGGRQSGKRGNRRRDGRSGVSKGE